MFYLNFDFKLPNMLTKNSFVRCDDEQTENVYTYVNFLEILLPLNRAFKTSFSFHQNEKPINANHFFVVKKLETEDEINFWSYDVFKKLAINKVSQISTKQGGKILFQYFLRLSIPFMDKKIVYLLFGILFEKRVHLVNKNIFSFSHFDVSLNKTFHFKDYIFLKIKKNKIFDFINEAEKYQI